MTPWFTRAVQVTIEPRKMKEVAATYTAAWNLGTAERFYSTEGHIGINRGEPWPGVHGSLGVTHQPEATRVPAEDDLFRSQLMRCRIPIGCADAEVAS